MQVGWHRPCISMGRCCLSSGVRWRSGWEDFRRIAIALIGIALSCSFLQFVFLRTGIPLLQPTYDAMLLGKATWRYGGPLVNPNSLANFFGMCAAFTAVLFLDPSLKRYRPLLFGVGAILRFQPLSLEVEVAACP